MSEVTSHRRDFLWQSTGVLAGAAAGFVSAGTPVDAWTRENARNNISNEYARINSTKKNTDGDPETIEEVEERIRELNKAEQDTRETWGLGAGIVGGILGALFGNKIAQRSIALADRAFEAAKEQPIDENKLRQMKLNRRSFLRRATGGAAASTLIGSIMGTGAATTLGTVDFIPQWITGRRSENELEAIDPEGKMPVDQRNKYKSTENWKDWRARFGFYGAPSAGLAYMTLAGDHIVKQEEIAFMIEQANLSNGNLVINNIENGKLIFSYNKNWFNALPEDNKLRKIIKRPKRDALRGGTVKQTIIKADEKTDIKSYLDDLKLRKLYNENDDARSFIDSLNSKINSALNHQTATWENTIDTATGIIDGSALNLSRALLIKIFHTDLLSNDLKQNETVMKFGSELFKHVNR